MGLAVDPEWRCQQSGDCCRLLPDVVMTQVEADILREQAPAVSMHFTTRPDGFVSLAARPCPLYDHGCSVYAYRPYNCRRFGCLRPDVVTEPFQVSGANMMIRVRESRPARRLAERMQRKAQRWALTHGWTAS